MEPESNSARNSLPADPSSFDAGVFSSDALVAVFENWKLLIAIPLLAALVCLVAVKIVPEQYVSTAYLGPLEPALGKTAGTIIHSPRVLDAVLRKFTDYPNQAWEMGERRKYLDERIRWGVASGENPKQTAIYVLTVEDGNPVRAQALASSIIDNWLLSTLPPPDQKERLQHLLEAAQAQLSDISQLIATVLKKPDLVIPDAVSGYVPPNMVDLFKARVETSTRIEELKSGLSGVSRDMIFAPATPGVLNAATWKVVAISAGVSLAVVLCWIFLCLRLALLAKDPANAAKLRRVGFAKG